MGKRKWWILAAISWMAAIFIFTQLPYFTGKNTAKVIEKAVVTEQNAVNNTIVNSTENINELNLIVRKVTHVMVFGILSVLLFKSLETFRFGYTLSWVLTVLYALSDEWHQSFMPGRVAAYRDVLIDSLGAFLALFLLYLISKKRRSKVNKEKAS